MVPVFHPSTGEADVPEIQASLVYIEVPGQRELPGNPVQRAIKPNYPAQRIQEQEQFVPFLGFEGDRVGRASSAGRADFEGGEPAGSHATSWESVALHRLCPSRPNAKETRVVPAAGMPSRGPQAFRELGLEPVSAVSHRKTVPASAARWEGRDSEPREPGAQQCPYLCLGGQPGGQEGQGLVHHV